jgi:hypothetical protein
MIENLGINFQSFFILKFLSIEVLINISYLTRSCTRSRPRSRSVQLLKNEVLFFFLRKKKKQKIFDYPKERNGLDDRLLLPRLI